MPEELVACHDCDLIHRIPVDLPGRSGSCTRCGAVLFNTKIDSTRRTLALVLAGIVLFVVANALPFLSFDLQGRVTETTLLSGVRELWAGGMGSLAGLVLLTAISWRRLSMLFYVITNYQISMASRPWNLHMNVTKKFHGF